MMVISDVADTMHRGGYLKMPSGSTLQFCSGSIAGFNIAAENPYAARADIQSWTGISTKLQIGGRGHGAVGTDRLKPVHQARRTVTGSIFHQYKTVASGGCMGAWCRIVAGYTWFDCGYSLGLMVRGLEAATLPGFFDALATGGEFYPTRRLIQGSDYD
ncbi:hypothetical protein BGX38DRAFT_597184 [Terfezia claveryi]|nr:hypothetical protein BGX38DRAFT_597184 [Terfezia claveryi]